MRRWDAPRVLRASSAVVGRWPVSAGRARRPCASQASTSKQALSPPRHRTSSSRQRARPTPGTGRGVEGSALMRQRVLAAVGCLNSAASAWRRQRRSAMPTTPEASAASCSRPRNYHREAANFRDYRAKFTIELLRNKRAPTSCLPLRRRSPGRRQPGPKRLPARTDPGRSP